MNIIELLVAIGFLGFIAYMVSIAPSIHVFFKTLIVGILCFLAIVLALESIGLTHMHHLVIK